jgi:hypothetical protein
MPASPLTIDVDVPDTESLFEEDLRPAYPHRGRSLQVGLAQELVNRTRVARNTPSVNLNLRLSSPPIPPDRESGIRSSLRDYFSVEAELVALELKVNQGEGWRSMALAIPIVIAAGLVAYPVYALANSSFVISFVYLMIITVVWVMLWDPIEKLVFDPIFIRLRRDALAKLRDATLTFEYGASRTPLPAP